MEKIKILVIEDNPQDAALIRSQLLSRGYHVCGIASDLPHAYDMFDSLKPDLSIVDILLNGNKDGITFAQNIFNRPTGQHPLIFLTGFSDKATFESARITAPFSYLLKPFNELELHYAVELALEKVARKEETYFATSEAASIFINDVFFVKKGNILAKILVTDIKYIEVDGKYCKLAYGNDKFVIQKSMKQLHDQLPAGLFIRIHRNFIANLNSIQKINLQDHEIILEDGKSLSFSRRYIDDLMQLFNVLK